MHDSKSHLLHEELGRMNFFLKQTLVDFLNKNWWNGGVMHVVIGWEFT
jgi:hypothetical protein